MAVGAALVLLPLLLAFYILDLWHADFSVPLRYNNSDAIWQFVLSKVLFDTGWVLDNPFLGAPDVAHWHGNASAQTSALHSVLMLALAPFARDAVAMQQYYYLANFPLIAIASYAVCRSFNISRLVSFCVGVVFSFTTYRYNAIFYAFLANHFIVPISLVPVLWVVTGRFAPPPPAPGTPAGALQGVRRLLSTKAFYAALAMVALTAVTDGYYAFFTLLLLGFAGAVRFVSPGGGRLAGLVVPVLLCGALVAAASALAWPLRAYERSHPSEFLVDGKPDPAMVKQPFEAEVYSVSLKLILAPVSDHRIPALARLEDWLVETSDRARAHPFGESAALGSLGSVLFVCTLFLIAAKVAYGGRLLPPGHAAGEALVGAAAALALFVFLCSTSGGVGTLVALVYPTIRAYGRFPLFLIFLLYFGAGVAATAAMRAMRRPGRRLCAGLLLAVTPLAVFDHMPVNAGRRDAATQARFLAERGFVRAVEAALPTRAMVYQYPHSQYLTDNRYYGWGSFAHIRLYLHSRHLHWSNGAFKNSPVDEWHTRLSRLPAEQLLAEVRAAGFQGFVVDRTVVPQAEYNRLRELLTERTGLRPTEDDASELAFWRLPDPGYRLVYDGTYTDPVRLVVHDPKGVDPGRVSRLVNPDALARVLARAGDAAPLAVERAAHPEVFVDAAAADRGLGAAPISPLEAMRGDVLCAQDSGRPLSVGRDTLALTVRNRSGFDWRLNAGPAPIRVGMRELLDADGSRLRWDNGFRVPGEAYVPRGTSVELRFPLAGFDLGAAAADRREVTAVFSLLQEGNAWFGGAMGDGECRVTVTR